MSKLQKTVMVLQTAAILLGGGVLVYRDTVLTQRVYVLHQAFLATENSLLKTQEIQQAMLRREMDRLREGR